MIELQLDVTKAYEYVNHATLIEQSEPCIVRMAQTAVSHRAIIEACLHRAGVATFELTPYVVHR